MGYFTDFLGYDTTGAKGRAGSMQNLTSLQVVNCFILATLIFGNFKQ